MTYITSTSYSIKERITKKGKVYDVIFRVIVNNVEKQKKLCGFTSKSLAKKGHDDFIINECELIKKPTEVRKSYLQGKEIPLLKDVITLYISSLNNQNKDSSIYDKINVYNIFVIPFFNGYRIDQIKKEDLYLWQDDLWSKLNPKTNKPYTYKYLSKIRTHFSALLTWIDDRYSIPNAFKDVKKPKKRISQKTEQFWTKEQFDKFISVIDNPLYKTLFATLFYTGRRKGEVLALTPNDVKADKIIFNKTLSRKTIDGSTYKITSTKNEKNEYTLICSSLKLILADYKPCGDFYFGGNKPIAENTLTRAFRLYCNKTDVPIIRIHDLRHSFVSLCIHLGASVYSVAKLIGDTPEQVLKTYGHLWETDLVNIINLI